MVSNAKFQGHSAPVLCLDISSTLLLSGSEDGTARLWDLREHKRRACLCIRVPGGGDVLSAVFSPPVPTIGATETKSIHERINTFSRDCTVYLGVENTVLEYDLRHVDTPIISTKPTKDWGQVLQNQDEVNQIGLIHSCNNSSTKKKNSKKKGRRNKPQEKYCGEDMGTSLYLVACDDAGKARWTETRSLLRTSKNNDSDAGGNNYSKNESSTVLHHDSHGVAVVPTCAFRPINPGSHKRSGGGSGVSLELATGGTDCKIQLWDIFRPKKPISTFAINQNDNGVEKTKPQVCNPPFLYSLAWSKDGKYLTAGLGDGTVGVFEINNRTLVQTQLLVGSEGKDGTLYYAHESSVASVVYPSFSAPTSDRILCSAGSDGAIVFWDLGKPNAENWDFIENSEGTNSINDMRSDDVVAQLFPPGLLKGLYNDDGDTNVKRYTQSSHTPQVLFKISHGKKINWVTPAAPSLETASFEYKDTIFVADTSPEITSYTIPFQHR